MDTFKREMRELDRQIIELVNQRYRKAVEAVAGGLPVPELTTADLEQRALCELTEINRGPMSEQTLQAVYREIISGQFALVRPVKVAFFGAEGSFTHLATLRKFGESVETTSRQAVGDVFDDVAKGTVDFGVVPVENSTEGAVTVTFDLFQEASVKIYSEIYVRIHHYLLANYPREELRVIYSHPQVFGQCRRWIQQNLPKCDLVEVSNTTAGAERAAREEHAGALAGILAAEKYGLKVLARNVEDFSENITRFLVLSRRSPERTEDDKTSVMFVIEDKVGALYDSLLPFKTRGVNLSMIQSRPSKRKSWDYLFFVDCLGHFSDAKLQDALSELSNQCKFVKILGSYPRAQEPV